MQLSREPRPANASNLSRGGMPGFFKQVVILTLVMCLAFEGCSQFVIASYLLHGPPTIEPEFDAEVGESMSAPKATVAVICFAPDQLKWKFPQIDTQMATAVTYRLGQNHIKVVPPEDIMRWVQQNPDWEKAEELGRASKAQYVIEIEIADFGLYEGNSTTLYRGHTVAYVHVVKMDEDREYGERIYSNEVEFEFPTKVPRSVADTPLAAFQSEYLSRLSERIGFLFYERSHGDTIGWAT